MSAQRFPFGAFVLDSGTGMLLRQDVPAPLGYRAALLLAALLRQPGEVLAKADLLDAAWPGIAVEEGNLTVQIAALRKLLGPAPEGGDWIATVPRVGYRFVGPVARRESGGGADETVEPLRGPSIAVLPFANLGGDPEQDYFADGLAEDIITRMARLRWLFVSARNSSFTYKGRVVDVKTIGRDLGVRYVLEGSVRRAGGKLRASAQLNDAVRGMQVWAERYDGDDGDFFTLQDRISESVIAAIEPQLYAAENQRLRGRPPESLDAWGFVMRAMPYVWTWGSTQDIEIAQGWLARAVAVDPDYSRANGLLSWIAAAKVQQGLADPEPTLATAMRLAERAVDGDPQDPWGYIASGHVHMVARRFASAVDGFGEAIDRNPSLALAQVYLGCAYGYGGMHDAGLHHLAIATRLSPRDFLQAGNLSTVGLCHLMARRFPEAIEAERRAVEMRPNFGTAWRTLAAAAGLAGDRDTAAEALAQARRLQPGLSLDWVERFHPIVQAADRSMYVSGLKSAGLA